LGLCHAGAAAALGLGELTVRSSLGQPLHATVKILGAGETTHAECFSLAATTGAAVPPPRAQLSLEQTNSQTMLHIRTSYALNDPIAQFALTSDCEARLRRDYVVLLDPPSQTSPAVSRNPTVVPAAEPGDRVDTTPAPPPARNRKADKRPAVAARPAKASSQQSRPSRDQAAQADSAPRLVLSGRHGSQTGMLALRFDTNLPDLNRPRVENLTPDELSDENTALTRKLAHLEAELLALHKRNAEIERKRLSGPETPAPPTGTPFSQWPLALLLIGLLVAAVGLAVVFRRRQNTTGAAPLPDLDSMATDTLAEPTVPRSETLGESDSMRDFDRSNPDQTTEVKDDILDQAEVYMAHGHGDLAIHLLQEHLRAAPEESPVPWLLLLDLLHREGDTESYAAACTACRTHFNINLNGHPVSQEQESSGGLEAYPHLLEQLVVVWGSPVTEDFFNDLIYDKRGGTRIGFEPAAYRDILLLRAISRDVHPPAI
jgi:Tfp pilus assembly protein FimV